MRTNPGANINTDWQINGIVKPEHVNALTKAIKYDYVIPADKIVTRSEREEEPDDLYELCGSPEKVDADVAILINSTVGVISLVTISDVPYITGPLFKIKAGDFVTDNHTVHIYSIGSGSFGAYGIKVESSARTSVYLHTSGEMNAAYFLAGSVRSTYGSILVGSARNMNVINNSYQYGGVSYEMAVDGELPPEGAYSSVGQRPWMSNAIGGGGGGSDGILRIFDTVAKKNQGLQYMRMVLGNDILAEVTGQDLKVGPRGSITGAYQDVPGLGYDKNRSAFIDMSEISGIDWTTWFTADMEGYRIWGDTRDYWDVTNPYTEMAIDTASMVIGRVYTIKIHVTKNKHDATPVFVETHQSEAGAGSLLLRYGYSSGSYGSAVDATVIYNGGRGLYPMINGSASATIMIQTAQGYYSGALPSGYQANDIVLAVTIGSATNTCVLRSNDSNRPLASDTAQTVSGTATMDMDGALYVAFQHVNRSSQTRYYQLVEPPKYLTSVSVDTSFTIPQIQFQERVPTPDGDYEWRNRDAFLILAPKDSRPAFYTPYLLAQGSSGDYGFSYLIPNFHPVHLDSRTDDPNGRSDPDYEESYPPEAPCYEAVVYMCRIDENHVLVLGY